MMNRKVWNRIGRDDSSCLPRASVPMVLWVIGVGIQAGTYCVAGGEVLSLISGLLGVSSVVLCSAGHIATFIFGFAQIATYTVLCLQQHLYGGVALNFFYAVTQVYGVWVWRRRMREAGRSGVNEAVPTRELPHRCRWVVGVVMAVVTVMTGFVLSRYSTDSQPWMDACATVPAVVAQVMMVMAYREQWVLWMAIDVLSAVMWGIAGDYCMVVQYGFWCVNCVLGWVMWSKEMRILNEES